jgi:multidrug efflux pump subunit AcrB
MSISEFFIRRPVTTSLLMLAILFFGMAGYRLLPVSDLPNVDFPTILVEIDFPGANPETMASAVATPLEKEFSTIAGLDSMSSTNALGISLITLQFNLSRNIDAAAQDGSGSDDESVETASAEYALSAVLSEGQSRGPAYSLPVVELSDPSPLRGG